MSSFLLLVCWFYFRFLFFLNCLVNLINANMCFYHSKKLCSHWFRVQFGWVNLWNFVIIPVRVIFTCISPIWAPIRAGSFSREKALYGAKMLEWATCHADPKRVTAGKFYKLILLKEQNWRHLIYKMVDCCIFSLICGLWENLQITGNLTSISYLIWLGRRIDWVSRS